MGASHPTQYTLQALSVLPVAAVPAHLQWELEFRRLRNKGVVGEEDQQAELRTHGCVHRKNQEEVSPGSHYPWNYLNIPVPSHYCTKNLNL